MADLFLRVPKAIRVNGRTYETVAEHNAVFEAEKQVVFAKFGAALSDKIVAHLNFRIGANPRRLIVAYRADDELYGFAAQLGRAIRNTRGGLPAQLASPAYYEKLIEVAMVDPPQSYVILTSVFRPVNLARFALETSGRSLLEVLLECRTSVMLVNESC